MDAFQLAGAGFEHVVAALTGASCEVGLGSFADLCPLTTHCDSGRRALAADDGEHHDA